ncbi:hypothetical protein H8N03_01825 [Ramlibacter sp. USB13]|uniref:PilY1 beta-propeller domain-containing protein n=1 Tax=Ramlibacter cellulosilyticus TaxID=2764187 RepID=A0A923S9W7_9BURK|nr:PilC/PilY family type IV pilus protein [Ramlibacter cellulosilyticus]MBC5781663.1 hypothetical protein [Ramlibacter cellulosilyticus]
MGRFLRQLSAVAAMLFAALHSTPALSQYTSDIDIYSGVPSQQDLPNVLILVDNGANWDYRAMKTAFQSTFSSLPPDKFRVGMAMFTQRSSEEGAFIWSGIRKLDANYREKLVNLVGAWSDKPLSQSGHKASMSVSPSMGMAEAWNYFAGKQPISGVPGKEDKVDAYNNTSNKILPEERAIFNLPGNAITSSSAPNYSNLFAVGNCAPNYVIFISNGPAGKTNEWDDGKTTGSTRNRLDEAIREFNYAHPNSKIPPASALVITPNKYQGLTADEWAKFMKQSDQQITTFTIDVAKAAQADDWRPLLKNMASVSGGEYFYAADDVGTQLDAAMRSIFNKIQAVDSVFASASLPVSVNARGTYLNQVFMGMFRPDAKAKPRWRGNLKQFRFGYDVTTDSLSLVDPYGKPAITGATGFVNPEATSYWTHASSFWINEPQGSIEATRTSDAPDGEVVEKGGVAQGIRDTYATSQDSRKIFTCQKCAANTNLATADATQFNTTNITRDAVGVATDAERNLLVNWFRGTDNYAGDEKGPGGGVTIRPSVHGDVLHSRPAVVNYGGTTGVVVFYGTNDGLLRAVNGNQTGTGAGQELWGFVAEEHLKNIKRLRANTPLVRLSTTIMPGTPSASDPAPRDYFADGPIGVYQKMNKGVAEKVILYAAMRRGGRFLYALDVTNPKQPVFLWKKSDADIPVLGQTWSEPKVARLRGHTNPVLIMGAGYDAGAEDITPPGKTTMGQAVLVLDATDGSVVKKFDTDRSVPADVSLVDADYDGLVDRAYAVDVGGNLYRLDFETANSTAKDDWSIYKVASLAGGSVRKFFYPPDVVLAKSFAAVLLATGDREKPLATTSDDRFFTVYDRNVTKGKPDPVPTAITAAQLAQVGSQDSMEAGCYIPFAQNGEKAVNAPVTAAGITYFSTNRPTPPEPGMCVNDLGEARIYSAPLFCKAATFQEIEGGGLPPSPVVGVVTVSYTVTAADGSEQTVEKQVPFIIGGPNSKNSGIEGSKVKPTVTPTRKRKYWYLENAR